MGVPMIPTSTNRSRRPVPSQRNAEVEHVLIPEDRIARRVAQLARRIERDFAGRDLVIVALLNGTIVFLADLIRHLSLPLRLDFIGLSSYGDRTKPGALTVTKELRLNLRRRDVLVVDDILDSGQTLRHVLTRIRQLRPRRVRVCVFLEKRARRAFRVRADYVGFRIPDRFVVGYGLDYAERYRNLPFVGILAREVCEHAVPGD
jgi:hypoxanthine phosphoribosyltransferase